MICVRFRQACETGAVEVDAEVMDEVWVLAGIHPTRAEPDLASLLVGNDAPIDPGDASGANLMDLPNKQWWTDAVQATAPGLADKLPAIADSWSVAGRLSSYWQSRIGLPAARVIAWSGDNPCSLIGVGLVREGRVAISLGTSDTIFGLMKQPRGRDLDGRKASAVTDRIDNVGVGSFQREDQRQRPQRGNEVADDVIPKRFLPGVFGSEFEQDGRPRIRHHESQDEHRQQRHSHARNIARRALVVSGRKANEPVHPRQRQNT